MGGGGERKWEGKERGNRRGRREEMEGEEGVLGMEEEGEGERKKSFHELLAQDTPNAAMKRYVA